MSRIINIGDFYRSQTSTQSVIESIQGSVGEIFLYASYCTGEVLISPSTGFTGPTGPTGPIEITTIALPPSVGQFVNFTLDTGSSGPYPVSGTGSSSGSYFFTISTPLPGAVTANACSVYADTGPLSLIRTLGVQLASSGSTQIVTLTQNVYTGSYISLIDSSGSSTGPFLISAVANTDTGATLFISTGLTQNYDGYGHVVQTRTSTTGSGNPISSANAHAKRQFGNHPRIQQ